MIITELIEQLKAMPEKMEGRNGEGELVVLNTHKLAESLKKSLRNCDKYKTAEEAYRAFSNLCQKEDGCLHCRFKNTKFGECSITWAYEEADKEVSK